MNLTRFSFMAGVAAALASGSAMAESISVWSSTSIEQRNGEQPVVRQEFYTNQPAADAQVSTFVGEFPPQQEAARMQDDASVQIQFQAQPLQEAHPPAEQHFQYSATATAEVDHGNPIMWGSNATGMLDMQAFFDELFRRLGMTPPSLPEHARQSARHMIYLNGFQQVPSVNTPAYGVAHFALEGRDLRYWIDVRDLTSPVTDMHFHRAPAGENGPVVAPIMFEGAHAEGVWNLSDQDLQDVMSGRIYINVHTQRFSDGEVRGQL